MIAIITAIISGIAMSVQGVFNTRLGEKIGVWEQTLVQGSALILTLIITFFMGKGSYNQIKKANKLYLLGGALGVVITYTVMKSISGLGPTIWNLYILGFAVELLALALIEAFGLFGSEKLNFTLKEFMGIAIMVVGIIVFKWKH